MCNPPEPLRGSGRFVAARAVMAAALCSGVRGRARVHAVLGYGNERRRRRGSGSAHRGPKSSRRPCRGAGVDVGRRRTTELAEEVAIGECRAC